MTKTILVIDDDKMLRDMLFIGLRRADFNVLCAESAEYANEVLSRISVDAIVLDRMMNGQDGLSFLKQIRQNGDLTPVIMLTAMSGAQNAIDGLSGGANDYLAKPFQLQELILCLNNITAYTAKAHKTLDGINLIDGDFFIDTQNGKKLLSLSNEEKKLLQKLITPVGSVISATPMVAKRLRSKINALLPNIDIITVRGMGYKIIKRTL
mgnify:CR=1 FL=1